MAGRTAAVTRVRRSAAALLMPLITLALAAAPLASARACQQGEGARGVTDASGQLLALQARTAAPTPSASGGEGPVALSSAILPAAGIRRPPPLALLGDGCVAASYLRTWGKLLLDGG